VKGECVIADLRLNLFWGGSIFCLKPLSLEKEKKQRKKNFTGPFFFCGKIGLFECFLFVLVL
jgi:hypothetical protein